MTALDLGWKLDVERGPDWIFIRPRDAHVDLLDHPPLAEAVWSILDQHFTYRLVLELQEVDHLNSYLIGQLILLHKRVVTHGGLLRICGLSTQNREVLQISRLEERLPVYDCRDDAVMSRLVSQPR